jgi:hypothetical protein
MSKIRAFFSNIDNQIFLITYLAGILMGLTIAQIVTK